MDIQLQELHQKTYKTHGINGTTPSITEIYGYTYDKAQRLTATTYSLNGGSLVTLLANTYDELGRVTTKNLGGIDATTYTYNIRSWTTEINGSRFSENLYYNSGPLNGANACYNGNIAAMQWSVGNDNLNYNRAYSFTYDNLNRLTNANYYGFGNGSVVDGTSDKYNETFTFDKMGNFNSLTRNESGTPINNLNFTYVGNQMSKVDNLISPAPFIPYGSEAFKDSLNVGTEYTYDKNGSTVSDLNTGISTIQYNLLNLPDQIQFIQGHKNLYTYDAAGKKLEAINYTVRDIVNVPIGTISTLPASSSDYTKLTTDYVGNMIYENGSLKEILLPEGYWQNGVYYYYLKDHLGNNRVVINNSGAVVEKSHYYPSGMRFYPESTSNSAALPYRYNGKEMEAMNGLNQYDYGARRRGAGLPSWTVVDPHAENNYSVSPYAYCGNNPVNAIDPDGQDCIIMIKRDANGEIIGTTISATVYITGNTDQGRADDLNEEAKSTFKSKEVNGVNVSFNIKYQYVNKVPDKLNAGENLLTFSSESSSGENGHVESREKGNTINNEKQEFTSNRGIIYSNGNNRTVLHETGHLIGLPDRYDIIPGSNLNPKESYDVHTNFENDLMRNSEESVKNNRLLNKIYYDQYITKAKSYNPNIKVINSYLYIGYDKVGQLKSPYEAGGYHVKSSYAQ